MDGPLSVQIPVQLLLELEPNLLVQNVIELEFELSTGCLICIWTILNAPGESGCYGTQILKIDNKQYIF